MKTVITYGTYDLLHYGHIRLLERAKALGDYLIVGVTADDFDKSRGKINVQQSLVERIQAVEATGLADKIIVEEYEGQKIDDIKRYDVDIFTVGSDWKGHFDYLKEYCDVVYLVRTAGVSSTEIRAKKRELRLGLHGSYGRMKKFIRESRFVNGVTVNAACVCIKEDLESCREVLDFVTMDYDRLLEEVDAVYITSHPSRHYEDIRKALMRGKHVMCESPIALNRAECETLYDLAAEKGLVLMDGIKTAYATAYYRLLLLIQTGIIGPVVSMEATCTSLRNVYSEDPAQNEQTWNSTCEWGPTGLLPIFQALGTGYTDSRVVTRFFSEEQKLDLFTKFDFIYPDAVASLKVGNGVKSEGELIISGTNGYIIVPAPWWKTDYFEIRYENQENNRRQFYQLDGEGIRYEIVAFIKTIETGKNNSYISKEVSCEIAKVMEDFHNMRNVVKLS